MRKKIDWLKKPEILWEKKQCPFCREPTGSSSNCFKPEFEKDKDDDIFVTKTMEMGGEIYSLFSKQCYFRKNNEFIVYVNFPISAPLCMILGAIEGVEKIKVITAYRMSIIIAEQFEEMVVVQTINKEYRSFINECAEKNIE